MANLRIEVTGSVRSGSQAGRGASSAGGGAALQEAQALKQVEGLLNRTSTLYQKINADATQALTQAVGLAQKSATAIATVAERGVRSRTEGERRVTTTTQSETQKQEAAIRRLAQIRENYQNRIAASEHRRQEKAKADAKAAADAEIRELERVAQARRRASVGGAIAGGRQIAGGIGGGASTAFGGIEQAAGTLAGGAGSAVSQIASGRLLSGDPFRAIGNLTGAALKAGGQLGAAVTKGLGQALSGGIAGLGTIIGSAFGPIGGVIGSTLGQALGGVAGVASKALGAAFSIAGELGGVLGNAAGEIAGFVGDKLGLALKVTAGAAIAAAFVGIRKAAQAEDLTPAFEKLAAVTGDTVVSALEKLRGATKGAISDLELMKNANRAVALGAASNVEDFGAMAESARQLGKTVGVDVNYALESMVLGIGRLSPRILDNLGLQVQLEEANEAYAASLGKTADRLTTAEQRAAVLASVMKQVNSRLDGTQIEKTSDKFQRFGAVVSNLASNFGKALLPAAGQLADIASEAGRALNSFLDNNKVALATGLGDAVKSIGNGLKSAAGVVSTIRLADIFDLAKASSEALWAAVKLGGAEAFAFLKGESEGFVDNFIAKLGGAASGLGGVLGKILSFGSGGATKASGAAQAGDSVSQQLKFGGNRLGFGQTASGYEYPLSKSAAAEQQTDLAAQLKANSDRMEALRKTLDDKLGDVKSITDRIANAPNVAASQATVRQGLSTLGRPEPEAAGPSPASQAVGQAGLGDLAAIKALLKDLGDGAEPLAAFIEEAQPLPEQLAEIKKALSDQAAQIKADNLAAEITQPLRDYADQQAKLLEVLKNEEAELQKEQKEAIEAGKQAARDRAAAEIELAQKFRQLHLENFAQYAQIIRSIQADVQSKRQGLEGLAGGTEAQGGLPLTIQKAIGLQRRRATKQRFEDLRNDPEFAGASAQNLADDPERLQRILGRQARRESGADFREADARIDFKRKDDALNAIEADTDKRLREAETPQQVEIAKRLAEGAISFEKAGEELRKLAGGEAGGPARSREEAAGDAALANEALKQGTALEEQQAEASKKLLETFVAESTARKASGEATVSALSQVVDIQKEVITETNALKKRIEAIEAAARASSAALKRL